MTTRRLACGALGILGLALYLWPAIAAPVVLWADSQFDLRWAREGVGIVSPAPRTSRTSLSSESPSMSSMTR